MTSKVRINPSGKEFLAQPQEALLEAALRSGLSLKYSCSNGSCGQCKARLVSGEIEKCRHYDYPLTEAEKTQGHFLLCSNAAAGDLVIEAETAGGVEDIPFQSVTTTVSRMERVSDEVMVLTLRTPRTQTLRFLAGQHVTLKFSKTPERNKSIASCPCNAMQLQFHISKVEDDPFSQHVFNKLKPSHKVNISGPWGTFIFDEESQRPVIFLAYETGFAPIKSIIEHAIALDKGQPMHLYWLSDRKQGQYLDNYCRAWSDALDNFRYTPLNWENQGVTNVFESTAREKNMARVADLIIQDYTDLTNLDVYLCGPNFLMAPAIGRLIRHGLPATQLRIDTLKRFAGK
jgi:CDP-4-dehydro-6-deoxyglucose reductase